MARLRSTRGVPWATLAVGHDEITVRRPFGRTWTFRRADTTVRWFDARLFIGGPCLSLTDSSQGEWLFTPFRRSPLRNALTRHGWPVDDERRS